MKSKMYVFSGQSKPINPEVRQVFNPTATQRIQDPPSLNSLVKNLYASSHTCAVFQYVGGLFESEPNYDPDDDANVDHEEEVITSPTLPPAFTEIVAASDPKYKLTEYDITTIEQATRGQSQSDLWHEYRKGHITASVIHRVKTKVESIQHNRRNTNTTPLLKELCDGIGPDSNLPQLKHGRETEPIARNAYNKIMKPVHKKFKIQESGLIISKDHTFLAASPDGLIACDCCGEGVVEIKCPLKNLAESMPPYMQKTGRLKRTHSYYSQCQAQMAVTGRKFCDFFVFSHTSYHLERLEFDDEHWNSLLTTASWFFTTHMTPYICATTPGQLMDVSSAEATSEDASATATVEAPLTSEDATVTIREGSLNFVDQPIATILPATSGKRQRRQKRNRRGNSMPAFVCQECGESCVYSQHITEDKDNSVMCEVCDHWYHWGCVGFSESNADEEWICSSCNG